MNEIRIAVTGHRYQRIKGQEKRIEKWIEEYIIIISQFYGRVILIDGVAQGVDQIAALVALKMGVQVSCYFPYRKKLYGVQEYIAENAAEVRFIRDKFQIGCYIERDRRMVDDCDLLLAVWDGKKNGGTWQTYKYALDMGVDIILYPGYI